MRVSVCRTLLHCLRKKRIMYYVSPHVFAVFVFRLIISLHWGRENRRGRGTLVCVDSNTLRAFTELAGDAVSREGRGAACLSLTADETQRKNSLYQLPYTIVMFV